MRHRSESLDSQSMLRDSSLFVGLFSLLSDRSRAAGEETHLPLVENLATDLCRSSSGANNILIGNIRTLTCLLNPVPSVRTPEATVLAFTLGKFSPDPPAAAAGQDGKVG